MPKLFEWRQGKISSEFIKVEIFSDGLFQITAAKSVSTYEIHWITVAPDRFLVCHTARCNQNQPRRGLEVRYKAGQLLPPYLATLGFVQCIDGNQYLRVMGFGVGTECSKEVSP